MASVTPSRVLRGASVLIVVLLVDARLLRGQQQPVAQVGDLAAVIEVLKDSGSTTLQRNQLVGKTYSGIVTIEDVLPSQQDKAIVVVMVDLGNDSKQIYKMRFDMPNSDAALRLRKGAKVRLRGKFKGFKLEESIFIGSLPTNWALFTDVVVEADAK
jgi:hypothetical protein